ncbi:hydantoin racemase [Acidovorax sp. CF316]|uniref:aspartate/glutamate racemase family protein n=1 Tax=Acidovorax sp. CF316 TaxID=1144317 RepID=UPI00026BCF32|nr:aspartate/glutamate racemase family protein [Acidovorax sp. CF316]EJE53333.1 hydantoin racemase [Acidovorax sp. CF316]
MNLLDDSLSVDLAEAGEITGGLTARFHSLTRYAESAGVKGVLFTCSAFGPAIDSAAEGVDLPTLKPNEAMFGEALGVCAKLGRTGKIGMVSTFAPSVSSMKEELRELAAKLNLDYVLKVECPDGALKALSEGNVEIHDTLVSKAAQELIDCDVIMLGQFSTSHMRSRVEAETRRPVLSSPDSAVKLLRRSVEHSATTP